MAGGKVERQNIVPFWSGGQTLNPETDNGAQAALRERERSIGCSREVVGYDTKQATGTWSC